MKPLRLIDSGPGSFSLTLSEGETAIVDGAIEALGHEPNGYFWEGVAKTLIKLRAPELDGQLDYDSEAGMFCAHGPNRQALERLGGLMSEIATSDSALKALMKSVDPTDFDD